MDADSERRAKIRDFFANINEHLQNDPSESKLAVLQSIKESLFDIWSEIRNDSFKGILQISESLPNNLISSLLNDLLECNLNTDSWQTIHGSVLGILALKNKVIQSGNRIYDARDICLSFLSHQRQPIRDAATRCLCAFETKYLGDNFINIVLHSILKNALADIESKQEFYALELDGKLSYIKDIVLAEPDLLVSIHVRGEYDISVSDDHATLFLFQVLDLCMSHNSSIVRQKACSVVLSILPLISQDKGQEAEVQNGSFSSGGMSQSHVNKVKERIAIDVVSRIEKVLQTCDEKMEWNALEGYMLVIEVILKELLSLFARRHSFEVLSHPTLISAYVEREVIFARVTMMLCHHVGKLVLHNSFEVRRMTSQLVPSLVRVVSVTNPSLILQVLESHDLCGIFALSIQPCRFSFVKQAANRHVESETISEYDGHTGSSTIRNTEDISSLNAAPASISTCSSEAVGQYAVCSYWLTEVGKTLQHIAEKLTVYVDQHGGTSSYNRSGSAGAFVGSWGMGTHRSLGEEQKRVEFSNILDNFLVLGSEGFDTLWLVFTSLVEVFNTIYRRHIPALGHFFVNVRCVSSDLIENLITSFAVSDFLSTTMTSIFMNECETNIEDNSSTLPSLLSQHNKNEMKSILSATSDMKGPIQSLWTYNLCLLQLLGLAEEGAGDVIAATEARETHHPNDALEIFKCLLQLRKSSSDSNQFISASSSLSSLCMYDVEELALEYPLTTTLVPTVSEPEFYSSTTNSSNIFEKSQALHSIHMICRQLVNSRGFVTGNIIECELNTLCKDYMVLSRQLCCSTCQILYSLDSSIYCLRDCTLMLFVLLTWLRPCLFDSTWQLGKLPQTKRYINDTLQNNANRMNNFLDDLIKDNEKVKYMFDDASVIEGLNYILVYIAKVFFSQKHSSPLDIKQLQLLMRISFVIVKLLRLASDVVIQRECDIGKDPLVTPSVHTMRVLSSSCELLLLSLKHKSSQRRIVGQSPQKPLLNGPSGISTPHRVENAANEEGDEQEFSDWDEEESVSDTNGDVSMCSDADLSTRDIEPMLGDCTCVSSSYLGTEESTVECLKMLELFRNNINAYK